MTFPVFRIGFIAVAFSLAACGSDSSTTIPTGALPEALETGPQIFYSGVSPREYYIQLPSDYDDSGVQASALGDDNRKPLLIALHGYTGSLNNWIGPNRFYDLVDVVADEAIMVFPNALPDANGDRSWNSDTDIAFFLNLLAELDKRGLQYNPNRIFVVGHSNGAGFAHEIGCRLGDIVRAVGPAAGALTSTECVGSTAMILIQGTNDPLVDINIARGSLRYWVLYNGWDLDASVLAGSVPEEITSCADYSFPGELNTDYPVLWCEHTAGHSWPDGASEFVWDFFNSLHEVEPGAAFPAGGGSDRARPPQDTTYTFRLDVPADMRRPLNAAASLFPAEFVDNPSCLAPSVFLNSVFSVDGLVIPGQVSEPITIPVTYFTFGGAVTYPSDWALQITVYVEGGNRPIPVAGVDHKVVIPLTIIGQNSPVVLDQPLGLVPAVDLCGF